MAVGTLTSKSYQINMTDVNGDHTAYTGVLIENGTPASGGTTKLTVVGGTLGYGPGEVINKLQERMRNLIAADYDLDANN